MGEDDPQAPVRRFARDVAHEINNVLTAILGLAERLEAEKSLTPDVREQVQTIAGHGRRLRRFSQQLGAFARGEAEAPANGAGNDPLPASAPRELPRPKPAPAASAKRILVVDDEEVVRKILSWQLQGMGYEVVAAESVEAALRAFDADAEGIGLALLDLVLGRGDGLALAGELRRRRASLPVIMLTGIDNSPSGGDPWLIKPVPLNDLRAAVESALARS